MTPAEAAAAVNLISLAWGDEFSPERAAIWISGLVDLPTEPVMDSIRSLTRTRATTPTIATIRTEVLTRSGLMPPSGAAALAQAERLLRYRDSLSYVNGSGWAPEPPSGVHPAVVAACREITADASDWERRFTRAYEESVDAARQAILGSDYGSVVAALGGGS